MAGTSLPYIPLNMREDTRTVEKSFKFPSERVDKVTQRGPADLVRRYHNGTVDVKHVANKVLSLLERLKDLNSNGKSGFTCNQSEKALLSLVLPHEKLKIPPKVAKTLLRLKKDEIKAIRAVVADGIKKRLGWNAGFGGGMSSVDINKAGNAGGAQPVPDSPNPGGAHGRYGNFMKKEDKIEHNRGVGGLGTARQARNPEATNPQEQRAKRNTNLRETPHPDVDHRRSRQTHTLGDHGGAHRMSETRSPAVTYKACADTKEQAFDEKDMDLKKDVAAKGGIFSGANRSFSHAIDVLKGHK